MATISSTTSAASIAKTLGAGSGIDLAGLVTSLVEAQFAAKTQQLTAKADKLTAQISGIAKLKSGISGFSSALTALAKGGSLGTQLTSSDSSVVRATNLGTRSLAGFSGTLEVRALAAAQSATTTAAGIRRTDAVGTGTITVKFGTETTPGDRSTFAYSGTSFPIEITEADKTLDGIAAKINAANRGLTASVVAAADGSARMVIKGPTGATRAFQIETTTTSSEGPGLSILDTSASGNTTISGSATDAEVVLDGIAVTRSTNAITDLVAGVRLDLGSARPGTVVALGATPASGALSQAVSDVVATYNDLLAVVTEETAAGTGSLYNDSDATRLKRGLAQLTLTPLVGNAPAGAPRTLAEIGVATNRDGTLRVDAAQLTAALEKWPAVVEAMFQPGTGATEAGLPAALAALSTSAVSTRVGGDTIGLDAATRRLTDAKADLDEDKAEAGEQAEAMKTRMTRQFAAMDARVAAYKATQAFMEQQVKIWTRSDD